MKKRLTKLPIYPTIWNTSIQLLFYHYIIYLLLYFTIPQLYFSFVDIYFKSFASIHHHYIVIILFHPYSSCIFLLLIYISSRFPLFITILNSSPCLPLEIQQKLRFQSITLNQKNSIQQLAYFNCIDVMKYIT